MQDLEYILKFTLNSALLRLQNIKDVSDQVSIESFKKKYGSTKTRFLFTNDGITFPMLNVPLEQGKSTHKVIYCEIATGDSLLVTKEYAKSLQPSDKYTSFIVEKGNDQCDVLFDRQELNIHSFYYVVKDQSRILPLYEVTFEYDEELEKRFRGVFICERCKVSQSTSFCPSEKANFCDQCDEEVHVDEFHKRHDRFYFNEVGKKRFIYCVIHPETLVDYFCVDCAIPVCTKCRILGNHSELPKSTHELIKYIDACDKLQLQAEDLNENMTPIMENIAKNVEDFKNVCHDWRNEVENVRQKIEDDYKAILNELRLYESNQLKIINAKYVESIYDLERMEKMKEYVSSLEPSQLVKNYKTVIKQRNELHCNENIEFVPKNVSLKGKLVLGETSDFKPRHSTVPRMNKTTKMFVETRGTKNSPDILY